MAPKKPTTKIHRPEEAGTAAPAAAADLAASSHVDESAADESAGDAPVVASSTTPPAPSLGAPLTVAVDATRGAAPITAEVTGSGDDDDDAEDASTPDGKPAKISATILAVHDVDTTTGAASVSVYGPISLTQKESGDGARGTKNTKISPKCVPQTITIVTLPPAGTDPVGCNVLLTAVPKARRGTYRVPTWGPPGAPAVRRAASMADVHDWLTSVQKSPNRPGSERELLHITSAVGPFRLETVGVAKHSPELLVSVPGADGPLCFRVFVSESDTFVERKSPDGSPYYVLREPFAAGKDVLPPPDDPARTRRPTFVGSNEVLFASLFLRPPQSGLGPMRATDKDLDLPQSVTTRDMSFAGIPHVPHADGGEPSGNAAFTWPARTSGQCGFFLNSALPNAPPVEAITVSVIESNGSGHYTDQVTFATGYSERLRKQPGPPHSLHVLIKPSMRCTLFSSLSEDPRMAHLLVRLFNVGVVAERAKLFNAYIAAMGDEESADEEGDDEEGDDEEGDEEDDEDEARPGDGKGHPPDDVVHFVDAIPLRPPPADVAARPAKAKRVKKSVMAAARETVGDANAAHQAACAPTPKAHAGIVAVMDPCDEKTWQRLRPKPRFVYANRALWHELPRDEFIHVVNRVVGGEECLMLRTIKAAELEFGPMDMKPALIKSPAGISLLLSLNSLWRQRYVLAFRNNATLRDIGLGKRRE